MNKPMEYNSRRSNLPATSSRQINFLLLVAALIFCASGATTALAQARVATVDMSRVLNEAPAGKKMRSDLDSKTQAAKERLEKKRDELKALEKKAKDSGAEDSAESLAFRSEARAYTEAVRDQEEAIRRDFLKANKALSEAAIKAVQSYATKNKIDLVVDSAGKPGGAVIFSHESLDITEQILKEIRG